MEKDPNKIENWKQVKDILSDADKSSDLHYALADNEETMHEKLWNLQQKYWKTINEESEFDHEITEKDVQEIPLSEVEDEIEKEFGRGSTEYKIFQVLKEGTDLKIFINAKTDTSYTYSPDDPEYNGRINILRWRGPVREWSKNIMMQGIDVPDEYVHMTKLIHELWHGLSLYIRDEMNNKLYQYVKAIRKAWIDVTKLWSANTSRYTDCDQNEELQRRASEDTVELIRMYIQDSEGFKIYLWTLPMPRNAQDLVYNRTKACVDFALSKLENEKK